MARSKITCSDFSAGGRSPRSTTFDSSLIRVCFAIAISFWMATWHAIFKPIDFVYTL